MHISKSRSTQAPVTPSAPSRASSAPSPQVRQPAQAGYSAQSSFVSAPKVRQVDLTGGGSRSPIEIARELVGKTPQQLKELKQNGSTNPLVNFFVSNTDTQALGHCASFVSSYLQAAGQQNFFKGTVTGAPNLYGKLVNEADNDGSPWTAHNPFPQDMLPGEDGKLTPEQAAWWRENMQEGAPVFFRTGDGNAQGHVVIYSGIVDGEPMFIGANSVDAEGGVMDGPQTITEVSYNDLVGWMSSSDHPSTITSAFSYDG